MDWISSHSERLLHGIILGLATWFAISGGFGFVAAQNQDLASIDLGQMRSGDKVSFRALGQTAAQGWEHEHVFEWLGPIRLHDRDGQEQWFNLLQSGSGEDMAWIPHDPESGTPDGRFYDYGEEALQVTAPTQLFDESYTVRGAARVWTDASTDACLLNVELSKQWPVAEIQQTLCDRAGVYQGDVSMRAEAATVEGQPGVRFIGRVETTVALALPGLADDEPFIQHRDADASVEKVMVYEAGVPYPTKIQETIRAAIPWSQVEPLLPPDGLHESGQAIDLQPMRDGIWHQVTYERVQYQPGSEHLATTADHSGQALPPIQTAASTVLGPSTHGFEMLYPLQAAFDDALSIQATNLSAFMSEHPGAYVQEAEHDAKDEQGKRRDTWSFTVTDGQATLSGWIERIQTPLAWEAVRHVSGLDAMHQTEYRYSFSRGTIGAGLVPSSPPQELFTVASIFDRWRHFEALDPPPEQRSYAFRIVCGADCDDVQYSVQAGSSFFARDRTQEAATDEYEIVITRKVLAEANEGTMILFDVSGEYTATFDAIGAIGLASEPSPDDQDQEQGNPAAWQLPEGAVIAGAGALGVMVAFFYAMWPRLAALAGVGLFSRIRHGRVLAHPVRRNIHFLIENKPGIHAHELARVTGKSTGSMRHHLRKLEEAHVVVARKHAQHVSYFLRGVDNGVIAAGSAVKSASAKRVLKAIVDSPGGLAKDVAAACGVSRGTVTHHMKNLADAGLIVIQRHGRTVQVTATPFGKRAAMAG